MSQGTAKEGNNLPDLRPKTLYVAGNIINGIANAGGDTAQKWEHHGSTRPTPARLRNTKG
ncbi:hypothetical protein GCM10010869_08200 [Mesorhizobium tianshanense]|nr:hypothetical protein GCM10010869_08200 [Mesorhizobium tianshanense]